jgi:hypothetical protein
MIKVPFPHMALNAVDVPGTHYRMWNTYEVPASHDPDHILDWTASVAGKAKGGKLETLVILCHGFSQGGKLGFGLKLGTGIRRVDTPKFAKLKGLVNKIWITACGAARISVPTPPGSILDGDGNLFCCEIAKQSGAFVTASTESQYDDSWFGLPVGYIDDWEGLVLTYGPAGNVVSSKRY